MMDKYLNPAELQRLLSGLLAVLVFLALCGVFAFLVVPGMRYRANTALEADAVSAHGDTGWLDPTDYPSVRKQVIPPVDPKTVMTATSELLARGRELFAQTCATCHGPTGHGDGPGGKGLKPAPRDFSSNAGWTNGTRIEDIFRTLTEGVKGTGMVSYSYLPKKERMALVHYVQSLGAFDHGASDPKARAALEELFGTVGETIPNRIPVRVAIDKLCQDSPRAPALSAGSASDPVLREAVADPARAARTLGAIERWDTDVDALARAVVGGDFDGGFRPVVATYSRARWQELQARLARR
jgi:mono/diheme cytochrome c family protein